MINKMTTNELIKLLNDRGYVVALFNHQDWTIEGEAPIPIGYIQSQMPSFQSELDETYSNIIETIIEDDYDDDWM
jgi:hypothetical protein